MGVRLADEDAAEKLLANPPASTEQILHPEKYVGSEKDLPTSVALPNLASLLGGSWKEHQRSNVGEFSIRTLFETWREWGTATSVAAGWDGDRYVYLENGNDYAMVWKTVWDTEKDASEFGDAFGRLVREKRFKKRLGSEPVTGTSWTLSSPVASANETSASLASQNAPLFARLLTKGNVVVYEITNSREASLRLDSLEHDIIQLDNTASK